MKDNTPELFGMNEGENDADASGATGPLEATIVGGTISVTIEGNGKVSADRDGADSKERGIEEKAFQDIIEKMEEKSVTADAVVASAGLDSSDKSKDVVGDAEVASEDVDSEERASQESIEKPKGERAAADSDASTILESVGGDLTKAVEDAVSVEKLKEPENEKNVISKAALPPLSTLSLSDTDSSLDNSLDIERTTSDHWHDDGIGDNMYPRALSSHRWMVGIALIVLVGGIVGGMAAFGVQRRESGGTVASIFTTIPTAKPSSLPTAAPTVIQTDEPTENPTEMPIVEHEDPTSTPTHTPSQNPTSSPISLIQYRPGELTVEKNGVLLSTGLDVRIIATSDQKVVYQDGTKSEENFHIKPDAGATFAVPESDTQNKGGWVYVSNCETRKSGGVGALTFNKHGEVIGYKMILKNTSMNCGGGKTPWGTWVTCEEQRKTRDGQIYEVDPFGNGSFKTVLGGKDGGAFESFAFDDRDKEKPRFYVTEDNDEGALRRFTPSKVNWDKPSSMLQDKDGLLEYLILNPSKENKKKGTYKWTTNKVKGERNAQAYFQGSEGIDVNGNELFFVSKEEKRMFTLDLDAGTWTSASTKKGKFDGSPDQLVRFLDDNDLLYFTEDGGEDAGIHARDKEGRLFTILESPLYLEETTGLAFSPDGKHMYLAYQKNGLLFDVWRTDGLPFGGQTLNLKYHSTMTNH